MRFQYIYLYNYFGQFSLNNYIINSKSTPWLAKTFCVLPKNNNIIKKKNNIFFIKYLNTILLMKKTKNSYKKSGVNIKSADKFAKYIGKYSQQVFKKN